MPVGVQCPISSSLGEFPSYWDWLWCPGLSPVLVSIALPFAFHTWCFPFALICHWISIVFVLYGRRIATHLVDPSLAHFANNVMFVNVTVFFPLLSAFLIFWLNHHIFVYSEKAGRQTASPQETVIYSI